MVVYSVSIEIKKGCQGNLHTPSVVCIANALLFKATLQVTDQVIGIFKANRNAN
jgi:hypothetical protein